MTESTDWFSRAQAVVPGGVHSPSRSWVAIGGGSPPYLARAAGAYLYDTAGRRYIDYIAALGPVILGHGHPAVAAAVAAAAAGGTVYGCCHPDEVLVAEALAAAVPGLEQVRFTASGTEAVMSAVRLARAATGRDIVVKFGGSYHGHWDGALTAAGSAAATLGLTQSAGIPAGVAADVVTVPYNDLPALERALATRRGQVAAVLVEPVAANMGVVMPAAGFLAGLGRLTAEAGALVIADEVVTGFRGRYGTISQELGLTPDIVCLGKVVGGGLPLGAYGGARALMRWVSPAGPMYQDGTWAGNPVSLAAARAALAELSRPDFYPPLAQRAQHLAAGLAAAAAAAGVRVTINRWAGMFTVFFTRGPVDGEAAANRSSAQRFAQWARGLWASGVAVAPSRFEALFITAAHTDADVDQTLAAAAEALRAMGPDLGVDNDS